MATAGGPNIETDGLVLKLDAVNIKSFRGEPTENKINPNGFSSDSNFTVEKLAEYTFKVTLNSMPDSNAYYIGQSHTSLANTTTTMSVEVLETSNPSWVVGISGWGNITSGDSYVDGFRYVRTITHTVNWSYSISLGYVSSNFRNNVNVGDYIIVRFAQIEQKAYATPFVNGTRGTTVTTGGGWEDKSGNSNHGQLVNGPTFDSGNGGSIVFDGVNDTINLGTGNTFFPLPQFTVDIWFKSSGTVTTTGVTPGLFGFTYGIRAHLNETSLLFGVDNGTGITNLTTPGTFRTDNTWYNATFYHTGTNMGIYINGVLRNSTNSLWSGTSRWPTNDWNIGRDNNNNNQFFFGQISSCRIYNRVLTAQEILKNYNATKNRFGL